MTTCHSLVLAGLAALGSALITPAMAHDGRLAESHVPLA